MGRTKKSTLGNSLLKERRQKTGGRKEDSWLHTTDLQDGYEWGRLNLQSVTEQSTLDDFLTTAEMAGKEFVAEKQNVKIVAPNNASGMLTKDEEVAMKKLHQDNRKFITVPRRPIWDEETTPQDLKLNERDAFLTWRRQLAMMQEKESDLILTPYEKNLDVWRQLWRVIERSNVICQIVDARNPLLFKCDDLSNYVTEIDDKKENLLIVNKADLLTDEQRQYWAKYFQSCNIKFVFWSALKETANQKDKELMTESEAKLDFQDVDERESDDEETTEEQPSDSVTHPISSKDTVKSVAEPSNSYNGDSTEIFDGTALLALFRSYQKPDMDKITIGLVGYPNVGKSSTINALMEGKKTAVSSTPGKTKHFQTLFPEDDICLCDCPGLVFPNFVSTKAEMVVNGILPIDQLREHIPPVSLVCRLIPRNVLEHTYGINIPKPDEGEDLDRFPYADELLSSYGCMRGFMTAHGMPDCPRGSRYILKDFVNSKLLYCMPPPDTSASDFKPCAAAELIGDKETTFAQLEVKMHVPKKTTVQIDKDFFDENQVKAHFNPPAGLRPVSEMTLEERMALKPWKKHNNRNKKEKLRRIHEKNQL